jgi:hypothetical protein
MALQAACNRAVFPPFVPAQTGTQCDNLKNWRKWPWVLAFAGTNGEVKQCDLEVLYANRTA